MPTSRKKIELKLRDLSQLFNSMDPSPFHEKDLDDDAQKYIVSWAHEFRADEPVELIVHLEKAPGGVEAMRMVREAVQHYFQYEADMKRRELRELLGRGRTSLIIGLLFMAGCIVASQMVGGLGEHAFVRIVEESLIIGGWVAMWRPLEIFLYDWWPIRRMQRLYERLSRMTVEVRLPSTS